ncbi:hypothetical protein R3P38DRAFT_3214985 [Favolaschia claudopus]|uniref:Uncharacterized protein n=1 Tax=Favolaschia claudopus TaxID=2862362 RepID=A0AAW0AAQ5_9AGAR
MGPPLCKLTGATPPAKARQGYQQFMHESYESVIEPIVRARWNATAVADDGSTLRTKKGINAIFGPPWRRAKDEAVQAKDEYLKHLKEGPSKAPEERQEVNALDNLGAFMSTLLREIYEHTGLVSSRFLVVPIPNHAGELRNLTCVVWRTAISGGGRLYVSAVDEGTLRGDVLDFMKEWLKDVYTQEQCDEAALAPDDGLAGAKYRFDDDQDLGFVHVGNPDLGLGRELV